MTADRLLFFEGRAEQSTHPCQGTPSDTQIHFRSNESGQVPFQLQRSPISTVFILETNANACIHSGTRDNTRRTWQHCHGSKN